MEKHFYVSYCKRRGGASEERCVIDTEGETQRRNADLYDPCRAHHDVVRWSTSASLRLTHDGRLGEARVYPT